MLHKKKWMFTVAAIIVAITIGIAIGVYSKVVAVNVEAQTIDTISELAAHDKNTIEMYVEFNWKNLERVGARLKRNADKLTGKKEIYEYLSYEADESAFDKIFILIDDGSYYTDVTYRDEDTADWYDYTALFDETGYKTVGFDNLPFMKEDKAVIYGYKLQNELSGITIDSTSKQVFALIGVCGRSSIKNGLVVDSFVDSNGNVRGHSSVITSNGDHIINHDEDASVESKNWFEHIEECKNTGITVDQIQEKMLSGEPFWFFHNDGTVHEIHYCAPLEGAMDWYFLLSVDNSALTEQTNSFVWMIVVALGITVLIIILSMIIIMFTQRKSENALIREKIQSEFLANMSHEIRTPLNGIVGLNYLMMTSIDDPKKKGQVKEWLSKSHSAAKYLLSLVNDVLDVSKLKAGKMDVFHEPMLIEGIIDAVYSMQCDNIKNRGINYSTDVNIIAPYILSDEVRIKQVLMNIISNAAKFTPAGGEIKLTVYQEKTDDSHVITTFICEDTGCGMSKEFLSKIFGAFIQDRNSNSMSTKGTGLGMFISKMIIDALGGEIFVESEPGKGSKFTVKIPAEISNLPEYVNSSVNDETERIADDMNKDETKPLKILVAEDNELNAEILVEVLNESGFDAIRAENGSEAVKLFEGSEENEFGLILMDMRMPVMDGCEAARTIRNLPRGDAKTVPIYACTANTFNEDRIKAFDSGMNDFLTKPVDIKVLLQKMEKVGKKAINEKNNGGPSL